MIQLYDQEHNRWGRRHWLDGKACSIQYIHMCAHTPKKKEKKYSHGYQKTKHSTERAKSLLTSSPPLTHFLSHFLPNLGGKKFGTSFSPLFYPTKPWKTLVFSPLFTSPLFSSVFSLQTNRP